jgi:CTP:molybdopterin cytidylyltransferase MocA
MSEYQYYEFQAIDRPLTEEEQQAVSRLSSRVEPHPWRAVFTYNWSDFPGNPEKVLAQYYDAMLYVTNWGSRQLMFRFPKALLDLDELQAYCRPRFVEEYLSFDITGEHVVLNVEFHEEGGGDWMEGEGWLPALIPLREDILKGDYRLLYLAWLMAVVMEEEALETVTEPPLPPGLRKLSPALRSFVEFFEIDQDLIDVAAEASADMPTASDDDLRRAIAALAPEERDEFLLRLAKGEPNLPVELKRRLDQVGGSPARQAGRRRKVGQLMTAAEELQAGKRRQAAAQAEAKRRADLEALARRETQAWDEVETFIQGATATSYQEAVGLLARLRDLAAQRGQPAAFQERLDQIYTRYRQRSALVKRLRQAGLVER